MPLLMFLEFERNTMLAFALIGSNLLASTSAYHPSDWKASKFLVIL